MNSIEVFDLVTSTIYELRYDVILSKWKVYEYQSNGVISFKTITHEEAVEFVANLLEKDSTQLKVNGVDVDKEGF